MTKGWDSKFKRSHIRFSTGNPARATLQLSILDMMNDVTNIDSASRSKRVSYKKLSYIKFELMWHFVVEL